MKGRIPKPTPIRIMEGNPGKRPLNVAEPRFPPGIAEAPEHLTPAERAEWERVTALLDSARVLTEADYLAMEVLAQRAVRLRESQARVAKLGLMIKDKRGNIRL